MIISEFSGKYEFLSNFSLSLVSWDNRIWETIEHLYQARKTDNVRDQEEIRYASTPGKAKRLGRKVLLRKNWEETKYDVMLDCVRLKFENEQLADNLISTFPHNLIEGNRWHDNEWGSCICLKCKDVQHKNMLGKILTQVREKLIEV